MAFHAPTSKEHFMDADVKSSVQQGEDNCSPLIWEALSKMQRKVRWAMRDEKSPLNAGDRLLLSLFEQGPRNIRDLSTQLLLERSWVSRMVASLARNGLVVSENDANDRRARTVSITPAGKQRLERGQAAERAALEKVVSALTAQQQEKLRGFLQALADRVDAPVSIESEKMHAIARELDRLGCASGEATDNVFGSGLRFREFEILDRVSVDSIESVSISDLYAELPCDMSTVSRTVKRLIARRLLRSSQTKGDARRLSLAITARGKHALETARLKAQKFVKQGLSGLREAKVREFRGLLERVVSDMPQRPRSTLRVEVRRLKATEGQTGRLLEQLAGHFGTSRSLVLYEKHDAAQIPQVVACIGTEAEVREFLQCIESWSEHRTNRNLMGNRAASN